MAPRYATDGPGILAAARRLEGRVHRTPVHTSRALDAMLGLRLAFKCENVQRGGSFKVRGALNALLKMPPDQRARGVLAHSSGNFAQGLAIAAAELGVAATIVMPADAPAVKQAAVRGYGAQVVRCAPTLKSRVDTVAALAQQSGATVVSPSDHPDVIEGQGTCGLELLAQVPELDTVVVPLGGGGLLSGIALACRHVAPHVTVIGAEPEGADDAARSRAAGRRLDHPPEGPDTICDGLRTVLGQYTWPVVRDCVHHVVRVPDAATRRAMRLLMERTKLVVEPSAAIGLAALLTENGPVPPGRRVGVVLSGGNLDLARLPSLLGVERPARRSE